MKKLLTVLMCSVILFGIFVPIASAEQTIELNVFNWGEYISDGSEDSLDVNAEFEDYIYEKTGQRVVVNYSNFDTNESMYAKLRAGGSIYDVICPSDYMISRLINEDMLEKIDFSNIPYYADIDPEVKNITHLFDPNEEYCVPYTWGVTGIIYNTTMVNGEITGWKDLWDEQYEGKILMFNSPRDAYAVAQSLLGLDYNSTDKEDWNAATEVLKIQKPLVQAYVADEIFNKMERGEAALAPYYVGDYKTMLENNPDLAFCLPEEGFNHFTDAWCIPKDAEHKELAEEYINFLCSPEIALANAEAIGYASPILSVKNNPEYSYFEDEEIYPSTEDLERGQKFLFLDGDIQQTMDYGWSEVKRTETKNAMVVILVLILIVAVVFLILKKIKKKKEEEQ